MPVSILPQPSTAKCRLGRPQGSKTKDKTAVTPTLELVRIISIIEGFLCLIVYPADLPGVLDGYCGNLTAVLTAYPNATCTSSPHCAPTRRCTCPTTAIMPGLAHVTCLAASWMSPVFWSSLVKPCPLRARPDLHVSGATVTKVISGKDFTLLE